MLQSHRAGQNETTEDAGLDDDGEGAGGGCEESPSDAAGRTLPISI